MKNEVTTAAHIRALFTAMRERKQVEIIGKRAKKGKLIIQRMDLDGIIDIYDQEDDDVIYDINPDYVKIIN